MCAFEVLVAASIIGSTLVAVVFIIVDRGLKNYTQAPEGEPL